MWIVCLDADRTNFTELGSARHFNGIEYEPSDIIEWVWIDAGGVSANLIVVEH